MDELRRFWNFLKEDSWQSWIVSLFLVLIFIRLVIFPGLSFVTGSDLPLVIVESCSMYHSSGFEDWWDKNSAWYEKNGITKVDFKNYIFKNGINKGDIIIVYGRGEKEKGEVIIFSPPAGTSQYPIIHRIVSEEPIGTKGDNNPSQIRSFNGQGFDETNIQDEQIIGKAVGKIPFAGWIKLIFFEGLKDSKDRGFCK